MNEFLSFFNEVVKKYPMHLEIGYNKTTDWCIWIYKKESETSNTTIVDVQGCDISLAFAQAHVNLKEWMLKNLGGY